MPRRVSTGKALIPVFKEEPKKECPHNFIGRTSEGYRFCKSCMAIFNWKGDVINND